jgi:AsmA protein
VTAALGFKRLGIAAVALVAATFGALALTSFLVPSDAARDAVKAQIRAVTGFDPVVRGDVSVSLFPYGTVNLGDVVFGDDRSAEPPFVAERLTANLHLLPLLLGRIEIADISLVRPRILIDFDARGRSNWTALIDTLSRALRPSPGLQESVVSFSEIRMAEGTVVVRDRGRDIREEMSDVQLSVAWPSISRSFGATGRITWRDEPLDTSISISDFHAALVGDRAGLKVRFSGTPIKLAFEGAMSSRPSLKIEGTLAADSPSLREVMRWGGKPDLPGRGFGPFALKAQTSLTNGSLALSNVHVELDGNAADGVMTFTSTPQALQGTLATEKLDLTTYSSTMRFLATNARGWDWQPFVLDVLSGTDLDLRLSSRQVIIGQAKLGRTAIAANLRDGNLMVTVGESQAFGGVVRGAFGLAKSAKGGDVKAQMTFADVDLDACLGDVFGFRRIDGKGTLSIDIDGSGSSVLAVTRTLNGTAELTGNQGGLVGFNVEQLLRRLERRPLSGGGDFRNGRTPFDTLDVKIKINQGVATVQEMRLEGASVRLAVGGTASIPARDFDLKGTAALLASANAPAAAFELPFIVHGPWDDPLMLPDPESLIRRSGAAAPLLDAVRDRKARSAIKSAIDRLTGGSSAPAQPAAGTDKD